MEVTLEELGQYGPPPSSEAWEFRHRKGLSSPLRPSVPLPQAWGVFSETFSEEWQTEELSSFLEIPRALCGLFEVELHGFTRGLQARRSFSQKRVDLARRIDWSIEHDGGCFFRVLKRRTSTRRS